MMIQYITVQCRPVHCKETCLSVIHGRVGPGRFFGNPFGTFVCFPTTDRKRFQKRTSWCKHWLVLLQNWCPSFVGDKIVGFLWFQICSLGHLLVDGSIKSSKTGKQPPTRAFLIHKALQITLDRIWHLTSSLTDHYFDLGWFWFSELIFSSHAIVCGLVLVVYI